MGFCWQRSVHARACASALTACALAGCGRLGFDARGGDAGGTDAVPVIGFSRIIAGDQTTCGIDRGRAYCWGRGTGGEIGDGAGADRAMPTEVALPAGTVTEVTQGEGHGCAIVDGAAYCWGETAIGSVAGPSIAAPTPLRVDLLPSPVTAIAAGGAFACAVAASRVYCWGDDGAGRLGNGAGTGSSATPVQTTLPAIDAVAVDAGNDHACALLVDDSVWCWGHNDDGALGLGSFNPAATEDPLETVITGALPAIAGWHACARVGGAARCWGLGTSGELGNGTVTSSPSPVTVMGMAAGVTALATGGGPTDFDATCGVVDGATRCWGSGTFGRLGDSMAENRSTPVGVLGLPAGEIVELALGYDHSCGRRADGTVSCWGRGDLGQLGDGASTTSFSPVEVVLP